jgi:hypothetical protein
MQRRISLPLVAIASFIALGLAACGDDSTSTPATQPTTDATLPPVDTSPDDTGPDGTAPDATDPDGIQHPTGADDVVLQISSMGGFVPVDYDFAALPWLLVTGDGRLIQQGPQIDIYPGPLLPNVQQRTISEAGIQVLLRLAEEHDLFRDVTYEDATNIADAPFTVVAISANGATYEHNAYALGLGGDGTETDEARAQLASFVEQANDVVTAAGADTLGPEEAFEATSYLIRAHVADASALSGDIEPTMVDWPADAPVRLADASECATLPVESFAELFASANQLTWYVEDGITYQLTVKPQLPGVPAG